MESTICSLNAISIYGIMTRRYEQSIRPSIQQGKKPEVPPRIIWNLGEPSLRSVVFTQAENGMTDRHIKHL